MSALARLLEARIAASGPITMADYMAECLLHPEHGYYTKGGVLGRDGDFTTAPEISQMFGELVGLSLAQAWLEQGQPAPALLAELGPGRGTLMADALRASAVAPGFREATRVHLVEASPALREMQARMLRGQPVHWHDRMDDVPDGPLFLIANEFFDALPIRQFCRAGAGWREAVVGLRPEGGLQLGLTAPAPLAMLADRLSDTPEGGIVELCPALDGIVTEIAGRIAAQGGAALIVDYGDWRSAGDTFQAVRAHHYTDPLGAPGMADLTAQVDFEAIARSATRAGAQVSAMVTQGDWLDRLGISIRAARLEASLPEGPARTEHTAAHRRLTHPQEMGSLFKVIGIVPRGAALPPGLEP